MQISAIGNYYNNLNNKYSEKTTKPELNKHNEVQLSFGQFGLNSGHVINNKFTIALFATMIALTALVAGCKKDLVGPHPNGYEHPAEPVVSNDGYPQDAPPEIKQEFVEWYQANCPYWNWPDWGGELPEDWKQQRDAFLVDVANWWHEHGFPDWYPVDYPYNP